MVKTATFYEVSYLRLERFERFERFSCFFMFIYELK